MYASSPGTRVNLRLLSYDQGAIHVCIEPENWRCSISAHPRGIDGRAVERGTTRSRCRLRRRNGAASQSLADHLARLGARFEMLQASMLGDARKHLWTDFFAIVKGENKIRPAFASKRAMRTGLPLDAPPNAKKGSKNTTSLSRGPLAHAVATEIVIGWARASPCSKRSARTRSART